jgi:hypothetical protein
VEDLDCGIGGVDSLAARSARATDFDSNFIGADLEFHFLGDRKNGHGCGGGVNSALGFGGGDALDAVDATFVTHGSKYSWAGQFEYDFF